MKVAQASSVISSVLVRKDASTALTAGEHVFIAASGHAADSPAPAAYPHDLQKEIEAGRLHIASVHFDERARSELNIRGITLGAGAGTLVGVSIGVLIDQLRAVHPTSAVAVDAACAVIGGVLGGALGSGKVTLEGTYDPKDGQVGFKIAPVTAK
jgi:hypothetical protein